jgi:two-component system, cell cycle sensor histidine kinase and response regulator CckA
VHRKDIALVLSDMVMPEMGGRELYRAIRDVDPDLKFVAMSGYSIDTEGEADLKSGMSGLLAKPVTIEDVAGIVSGVLKGEEANSGA